MDVKILEKGLKIIEKLAEAPEGLTPLELAQGLGLHKSSIYRYLNTLLKYRYIQKNSNNRFQLGIKVLELGGQLLRRMPLREVAHSFLIKLSAETEKTVHLCILDKCDVVYLDKVEGHHTLPLLSRIGSRAPAHCTAVGKALLGFLPSSQLERWLQECPLTAYTPQTITEKARLIAELRSVAERGYALDRGEHELHINCIAAPIRDYSGDVIASISITGLDREFTDPAICRRLIDTVQRTAREISEALGYTHDISNERR